MQPDASRCIVGEDARDLSSQKMLADKGTDRTSLRFARWTSRLQQHTAVLLMQTDHQKGFSSAFGSIIPAAATKQLKDYALVGKFPALVKNEHWAKSIRHRDPSYPQVWQEVGHTLGRAVHSPFLEASVRSKMNILVGCNRPSKIACRQGV